jgi:transposase
VLGHLPVNTRFSLQQLLEELDLIESKIKEFEHRMREIFSSTEAIQILMSMPGVGFILGVVIMSEIGNVSRFPSAEHFASYAGTTPRVHSSGGKTRYGQSSPETNRYLKWAFYEAANAICRLRKHWPYKHVSMLYERVKNKKGHSVAIGAVARHLAESAYWVLKKEESYREPLKRSAVSSTKG